MSDRLFSTMEWLENEDRWLAPYAMRTTQSRGRVYPEPDHAYRTPYQRDRERIVYSTAFRRMTGKTQVLVASVNDHHRTRLTHTLEVAQVARTVARRLRLNEDLTEAIALAHDIGHPPFGHAGEDQLDECLKEVGGFDHNLYGLRRVDELEERYPDFPGLNLTFEVREAFICHSKDPLARHLPGFGATGSPILESQVVDVVDSIAYDTHDIDDALGLGFVTLEDLKEVEFWRRAVERVLKGSPQLSGNSLRIAVTRELLAWQVTDLLEESMRQIEQRKIRSFAEVRSATDPVIRSSPDVEKLKRDLERFLRERVYRHHRVLCMTANGKRVLRALFEEYVRFPELLPERHLRRWSGADSFLCSISRDTSRAQVRMESLERVVADYLAGMTDRFAQQEYRRLFHPAIDL